MTCTGAFFVRPGAFAAATLVLGSLVSFGEPGPARADDTIKHPGDHPAYAVEIEPHALLGLDDIYASSGFGAGVRFSIPVVQNGFVRTINNSVAVTFGVDLLHYGASCGNFDCTANYLFFPVAMQWNFYVARKWSVFGEPGFFLFHGFFDDCANARVPCFAPGSSTGIRPALFLGGRYHFTEHVALTMRVGYPTFSVGVSFM